MRRALARSSSLLAPTLLLGAALVWLAPSFAETGSPRRSSGDGALVREGRGLFVEECSSCHGFDARGVEGQGPDLRGVGALAADFYLRTGRMPLSYPDQPPTRAAPRYTGHQIRALDAYIGSLGGPAIPRPDPAAGSLTEGQRLFTSSCAGCHTITGEGGVATGASAPRILDATPSEVVEAIRIGPYLMPRFPTRQIDSHEADDLVRYAEYLKRPTDSGGWSIGRIGPVPEGMVAWLLAGAALLLVALVIGERRHGGSR